MHILAAVIKEAFRKSGSPPEWTPTTPTEHAMLKAAKEVVDNYTKQEAIAAKAQEAIAAKAQEAIAAKARKAKVEERYRKVEERYPRYPRPMSDYYTARRPSDVSEIQHMGAGARVAYYEQLNRPGPAGWPD